MPLGCSVNHVVQSPTAVMQPAGGSTLLPDSGSSDILGWLDFEETSLRPAVLSQDAAGIKDAVQNLQSALGSSTYLAGDSLSLADIVIYTALLPIQVSTHHSQLRMQCPH